MMNSRSMSERTFISLKSKISNRKATFSSNFASAKIIKAEKSLKKFYGGRILGGNYIKTKLLKSVYHSVVISIPDFKGSFI